MSNLVEENATANELRSASASPLRPVMTACCKNRV